MPTYIKIEQDCVGRLQKGYMPNDVAGLMTEGLSTCVAIIIHGSKGYALIHDSGKLTTESIVEEFKRTGELIHCYIVYNPHRQHLFSSTGACVEVLGAHIEAIEKVMGNISGKISDKILIAALKDAELYVELIPRGGVNCILVEGGINLSGGQRQRLEIARALVKKPKILI